MGENLCFTILKSVILPNAFPGVWPLRVKFFSKDGNFGKTTSKTGPVTPKKMIKV